MESHAFPRSFPAGLVPTRGGETIRRGASRVAGSVPAAAGTASSAALGLAAAGLVSGRARRPSLRRPLPAPPCSRISHERPEKKDAPGRPLPLVLESPAPTRPARTSRRTPFLTWTRLLLGRDGLAAISMTGVVAILLFL